MQKKMTIYASLISFISLVCMSCNNKNQENIARNMRLPADATHLDFTWPELEAYGLKSISFHMPREKIDTSRIRLASDGTVEKVFFNVSLKDISLHEVDKNAPVRKQQLDKNINNIYFNYIEMHPYPFTYNSLIEDFNKNIKNTSRPPMILDGMQNGMTRYTLVECYTPEQLSNNSSAQNSLILKPIDENTPENCFLNRNYYYLTNLSLSESEFYPMAAECNGGHCEVRFSIQGRALTISMAEINIKYMRDISIASRSQLEKFIHN